MDLGSEGCFIDIRLNGDRTWLGVLDKGRYHLVKKVCIFVFGSYHSDES